MKRKKKGTILAVMLFVLIFSLAGCARPGTGKALKSNSTSDNEDSDKAKNAAGKESQPETQTEEIKEESSTEDTRELETTGIQRGKIEGNHYENEWMNLKIDVPESFVMLTQEEIDRAYNLGSQYLEEDAKNLYEIKSNAGDIVYEMAASSPVAGAGNMLILVENTKLSNITSKQLADAFVVSAKNSILKNAGYEILEEPRPVELAGEEFYYLHGSVVMNGVKLNSDQYVRAKDGYGIEIGFTYSEESTEQMNELLSLIQPYTTE